MATSFHVAGLCPSASQFLNDDFQRGLARWNRERLSPQMIEPDWADRLVSDQRMLRLEGAFLEELRHEIAAKAGEAPDEEIGRAHVRTPVPNAHLVCRTLLEKKNN